MGRVTRWGLVSLIVLVAWGCEDDSTCPRPVSTFWPLRADSMNLAILVSDYLSYRFEAGALAYYPPCATCDRDSLPFDIRYNPPGDFGDIAFLYTETGDTLFFGSIVWNGTGRIEYPTDFLPASRFTRVSPPVRQPLILEYFGDRGDRRQTFAQADTAWQHVRTLDIVRDFALTDYRVGVFFYAPAVGLFDPNAARWIIFLYRGATS